MEPIDKAIYRSLNKINPWCHFNSHKWESTFGDYRPPEGPIAWAGIKRPTTKLPYLTCKHCHKRSNDKS